MNENTKTAIFAGIAVVTLAVAILVQPSSNAINEADTIGQPLFAEFDPLTATTLEIVTFNEDTGEPNAFQVKQTDAGWVIPSHQNYNADADDQMKEAAASLIGLKKLALVTADKAEWDQYQVNSPNDAQRGDEGVGRLIRLNDSEGNTLSELIVGLDVKDQHGQHYVRIPGDDRVYISNIDPSRLSNKFADWIEKDLLKMEARSVKRIVLDNHSIDEANRRILPGEKLELTFQSGGDAQWTLKGMTDDLKVKDDALNDMKSAIDDLKIVNVDSKPELLVSNLRKGQEFFEDLRNPANEAIWGMLNSRGFFPVGVEGPGGETQLSIFSNEGQIFVGLDDGVEYVLRFGEITENDDGAAKAAKTESDDATKSADPQDRKGAGYSRYIYVVARVNEDLIDKPTVEPLPEWTGKGPRPLLPGEKATEPSPLKPENLKPQDTKPDAKKPDATPKKGAPGDDGKAGDAGKQPEKKGDAKDDNKTDAKAKDAAAKTDDQPNPETDSNDDAATKAADAEAAKKAAEEKKKSDEEAARIAAEIERQKWIEAATDVQRNNQRAQDEYKNKLEAARKRVEELNARFAPWYFVIADTEYQKIHLERKDIVEPNEAVINQREGAAFLAANKAKEGVKTTESGLQYTVLTEGTGKTPTDESTVVAKYKGTLLDGTVFDETKGDATQEFPVTGVIKGWTEALKLMKTGAKWKLFIPGDLAYGEKGSPPKIGPNAVLIFEIELVEVK